MLCRSYWRDAHMALHWELCHKTLWLYDRIRPAEESATHTNPDTN